MMGHISENHWNELNQANLIRLLVTTSLSMINLSLYVDAFEDSEREIRLPWFQSQL